MYLNFSDSKRTLPRKVSYHSGKPQTTWNDSSRVGKDSTVQADKGSWYKVEEGRPSRCREIKKKVREKKEEASNTVTVNITENAVIVRKWESSPSWRIDLTSTMVKSRSSYLSTQLTKILLRNLHPKEIKHKMNSDLQVKWAVHHDDGAQHQP